MQWLNQLVDEIIKKYPEGDILISSGASPSGTYHVGSLWELTLCDAILLELRKRNRRASHIHFVDDLDAFRKVPVALPDHYKQYLGKPLCDIPAPDGSNTSYADYFLSGFTRSAEYLGIDMEVVRSHKKYRAGFFAPAIESALESIGVIRELIQEVTGRKLDKNWSPIQVMEDGYLKKRAFVRLDTEKKYVYYEDKDGNEMPVAYDNGDVTLDWRVDWPARWKLLDVRVEPFGRDHATKGGSYDTGKAIVEEVFKHHPPIPVGYDFIHRSGDTKKMSASKGTGINAEDIINILPPELMRYFLLRYPPTKRLFFDEGPTVIRLFDEFSQLSANEHKSDAEEQLYYLCTQGLGSSTISRVPFSHLVSSYQAALRDVEDTLDIIRRTEHKNVVEEDEQIIRKQISYIDAWLKHWAPDEVKFRLREKVSPSDFSPEQATLLRTLGDKVAEAPEKADGEWFHKAIYDLKESSGLTPQDIFKTLYQALIGQDSGPRAGWFLSILPRDWLVKRLHLNA